MEKWGGKRKKVGGGSEEGGVNEGRKDYCWKNEGEEDGRERENPNWKNLHAVQKGECGENNG